MSETPDKAWAVWSQADAQARKALTPDLLNLRCASPGTGASTGPFLAQRLRRPTGPPPRQFRGLWAAALVWFSATTLSLSSVSILSHRCPPAFYRAHPHLCGLSQWDSQGHCLESSSLPPAPNPCFPSSTSECQFELPQEASSGLLLPL